MDGRTRQNVAIGAECTGVLKEDDAETNDGGLKKNIVELKHANERKYKFIWYRIIILVLCLFGCCLWSLLVVYIG